MYHNINQQAVSDRGQGNPKQAHVYGPKSLPWSLLLMKMLPFSLLEVDDSFSITNPFPGFRFFVINHVSAPKIYLFDQCNMSNGNKTGPYSPIQ